MNVLDDFETFKKFLLKNVLRAKKLGISDKMIVKGVDYAQYFLANFIKPENPEEKLLKNLWELGDKDERRALSNMLLKLVKTETSDKSNQDSLIKQ